MTDLIPRCAWCNAFRNEEGRWVADAPFKAGAYTHGICPECKKTHFSEVYLGFLPDVANGTSHGSGCAMALFAAVTHDYWGFHQAVATLLLAVSSVLA
jgi:hypothetical protein